MLFRGKDSAKQAYQAKIFNHFVNDFSLFYAYRKKFLFLKGPPLENLRCWNSVAIFELLPQLARKKLH